MVSGYVQVVFAGGFMVNSRSVALALLLLTTRAIIFCLSLSSSRREDSGLVKLAYPPLYGEFGSKFIFEIANSGNPPPYSNEKGSVCPPTVTVVSPCLACGKSVTINSIESPDTLLERNCNLGFANDTLFRSSSSTPSPVILSLIIGQSLALFVLSFQA